MLFLLILMEVVLIQNAEANTPKFKIPEKDAFLRIYQEPYILDVNDCSNKAGQYTRYLISKGYNVRILVVTDNFDCVNNTYDLCSYHALVEWTRDDGKIFYLDPTNNQSGTKLKWKPVFYVSAREMYEYEGFF